MKCSKKKHFFLSSHSGDSIRFDGAFISRRKHCYDISHTIDAWFQTFRWLIQGSMLFSLGWNATDAQVARLIEFVCCILFLKMVLCNIFFAHNLISREKKNRVEWNDLYIVIHLFSINSHCFGNVIFILFVLHRIDFCLILHELWNYV